LLVCGVWVKWGGKWGRWKMKKKRRVTEKKKIDRLKTEEARSQVL